MGKIKNPEKCRYCGLIHKSDGDECHPDMYHIMNMLYDAEDKIEELTKEINELNSLVQELKESRK